jgi:Delta3-Delta2-enoyl-CoA isomerase
MVTLTIERDVVTIDLGDDENRFTVEWIAELSARLEEVAEMEGPRAVVTLARGKFWSNGLDLDWLIANRAKTAEYIGAVQHLFVQYLTLPAYSVAVLQGHCFAAGALLALAHDSRVMRADRGFFCLPEVDLGIPFTPGMSSLIQSKLSPDAAIEAMVTGKRFGGLEAAQVGIVEQALDEDQLLSVATTKAEALAEKAGEALAAIRSEMFRSTIESLNSDAGLTIPSS